MVIEVCDLCDNKVNDYNRTEVIIRDHKGLSFDDFGYPHRSKRSFKGVICDDCLNLLKNKPKKE